MELDPDCPGLVWGTWGNETMQRQRGELVPIGEVVGMFDP